jgi:hypothetical protein
MDMVMFPSKLIKPLETIVFPAPVDPARLEAQRRRFTASSAGAVPQGTRADDARLAYRVPKGGGGPASRDQAVSQPRRTAVRLSHVAIDPRTVRGCYGGDGTAGLGDGAVLYGLPLPVEAGTEAHEAVRVVNWIGDDGESQRSDCGESVQGLAAASSPAGPAPQSVPASQQHYVASARVHAHPPMPDRRVRAGGHLTATRLARHYTTGAAAQVPPQCRGDGRTATGSAPTLVPWPLPSMHGLVTPTMPPVRGSVVLASLRGAPQPPPNAARTRLRGELVYDGPSHLLREQAHALFEALAAAAVDAGSSVASRGSAGTGGTPAASAKPAGFSRGSGSRQSRSCSGGGGSSVVGTSVASLQFEPQLGRPRVTPFAAVDKLYHHGAPSLASIEFAARKSAANSAAPFRPNGRRTKQDDKPRFPIR